MIKIDIQTKQSHITKLLGNAGEEAVANMLEQKGFTILARNYLVRGGEIDIIASCKDLVVFVEVKTRAKATFSLCKAVTISKQRKIIFTAKHFLMHNKFNNKTYRFDIALIEDGKMDYIPNAFLENR